MHIIKRSLLKSAGGQQLVIVLKCQAAFDSRQLMINAHLLGYKYHNCIISYAFVLLRLDISALISAIYL